MDKLKEFLSNKKIFGEITENSDGSWRVSVHPDRISDCYEQILKQKPTGIDWLESILVRDRGGLLVISLVFRNFSNSLVLWITTEFPYHGDEAISFPSFSNWQPGIKRQEEQIGELFGIHFYLDSSQDRPTFERRFVTDFLSGYPLRKNFKLDSHFFDRGLT